MTALFMTWLIVANCVDLAQVPPAFRAHDKRPIEIRKVDQRTLRESLRRDDGSVAERVVSGCEVFDVTLAWRELKGRPPRDQRALFERALKELNRTPFVSGDRSEKKFREALKAAIPGVPRATKMNEPIPFACATNVHCSVSIGGEIGKGYSIFLHWEYGT